MEAADCRALADDGWVKDPSPRRQTKRERKRWWGEGTLRGGKGSLIVNRAQTWKALGKWKSGRK